MGWAVLFLVGGFGIMVALALGSMALTTTAAAVTPTPQIILIQAISGLIGYGVMTWLIGRKALRLSWSDLRWTPVAKAERGFAAGLALGAAPAAFAILLAVPIAGARIVEDAGGPGDYLRQVGLTTLILLPAALLEEMMFRGVAQIALARCFGRIPTIIALSLLFALAHIFNDNTTALGLANIALAGVFLGLALYAPGGIWTAWGAHLGWNATLAAFDAPVSGLPFPIPMINYLPGGPSWLTGGAFGPEGGLLASITILLAIVVTWRWLTHSKEPV